MTEGVLIAGGGPVGMTLASELARYGIPVRILDRAAARTDKSKALVLWSRTLELLDRGGDGGAGPFVTAGFPAEAVTILAGGQVIGRIGMGGVQSPFPYGLMLPQSETERLLEERLAGQGVTVERQVELASFTCCEDGVEAVLRHAGGREEAVAAAWLVGCDGAHSTVRHGLGLAFTGETLDSGGLLADVHLSGLPLPDSEVSVHWHREGVLVVFPITPGRYRIVADLPAAEAENSVTLEQVQALIDRRGPAGVVASDPVWLTGFRINSRKVGRYRAGRAFLADDAAHIHSPAGGQGMNIGMQDAFNLAWKLALVIRGTCAESLLDSFSPERSAVGEQVLKVAGRLTSVATLRNPVAQFVRNTIAHMALGLAPVRQSLADRMTEVSISYPDSPLNGPGLRGGPAPGERVALARGQSPVGSSAAPRFALFAERSTATEGLLRDFSGLLDPELRPAFRRNGIWLVRPDGYVACAASEASIIARYIEQFKV